MLEDPSFMKRLKDTLFGTTSGLSMLRPIGTGIATENKLLSSKECWFHVMELFPFDQNELKSDNDENEFTKVKENREYLKPFSQLFKNGLKIDSPLGYYLARVKVREEEEEQRRIEAEKLAEYKRLKEKEAREAEERMLRMNQQREGGLEPFLSSKDFKAFANKTTQWKNKFGYIPKDQHEHILKALQQYKEKDRALMVDTKKGFGNGWSWRQVEVWVGKEMAQEWFDEFVKN